MKVVIIGYGNPLRGDDGVGWYVAGRLAEIADPASVQVMACHQLLPELSATIAPAELTIFIDAECGAEAGRVQRVGVFPEGSGKAAGTHALTPQRLLALARDIYKKCPRAELFTVGGQCFDHHEGLSPAVRRACDQVIQQIKGILGCKCIDEQVHGGKREMYGYA